MSSPKVDIKSLIYSEFHAKKGPKITYQIPTECISNEEFVSYFIYIIPKAEAGLNNKLITVNTGEYKILGCPVKIVDPKKYKHRRNELLFNLCFVFDEAADPQYYEVVVKKLSSYLRQLELDCEFLSNEENIENLPGVMTDIFYSLNRTGYCSINMKGANTIHLKVSPCLSDLPVIQDYDVPLITTDTAFVDTGQWDLTTQQVLPYLNGLNHITRVAIEADIEVNLVKACVQNLLHYNVVKIISIFQYGNVYATTPEIRRLVDSVDLQDECVHYVCKAGTTLPTFRDVFTLFCALTPGTTVKDLCTRYNLASLRIDESSNKKVVGILLQDGPLNTILYCMYRKLVQFGLLKDFIRRLEKYPVKMAPSPVSRSIDSWFTGHHSYDDICCRTGLSNQDLDTAVESDPTALSLWK